MPTIRGVDNEIQATRRQDIEKTKDDTKFEMSVHKPSTFGTQSEPTPEA